MIDDLLARLQAPDVPDWEQVEEQIWKEWSKSGSDAMDLLLERGREALAAEDFQTAIEHFTALTDHAPDFAEGWNGRATAYFHAGLIGLALDDIRHTLALNPRHFGAMTGLASILVELGREKEALEVFRRAHSLNPHRPDLNQAIERLAPKFDGVTL